MFYAEMEMLASALLIWRSANPVLAKRVKLRNVSWLSKLSLAILIATLAAQPCSIYVLYAQCMCLQQLEMEGRCKEAPEGLHDLGCRLDHSRPPGWIPALHTAGSTRAPQQGLNQRWQLLQGQGCRSQSSVLQDLTEVVGATIRPRCLFT